MLKGSGTEQRPSPTIPAVINGILQVAVKDKVETFIAVRRLKPLLATHNPFADYPFLHLSLYSAHSHGVEIVLLDRFCAHFASLPIIWEGQDAFIVNSLDCS